MDSFMDKFMSVAGRIGGQKHMTAIRDGFASTLPLTMAGALSVMVSNVLLSNNSTLKDVINFFMGMPKAEVNAFSQFTHTYINPWIAALDAGTLSLIALAVAVALAYVRASNEEVDPLPASLVAMGSFFILAPLSRVSDSAPWITHYFGAMGIFVGLLVGLITAEIYIRSVKKGWGDLLKLPDMVPPAVGRAFMAVIPGAITLLAVAAVPWLFTVLASNGIGDKVDGVVIPYNLFKIIETTLQSSLMKLFGSFEPGVKPPFLPGLFAAFFVLLIQTILWFFGLHGANMMSPVVEPIWGVFSKMNMQAFQAGKLDSLNPWVSTSWVIYANLGGSGATIGLLIAIFFFGKRPDYKQVAEISVWPGIFEINEPVIFGIPIVLNPLFLVPFLFAAPTMAAFGYVMSYIGFAGPVVTEVVWTTPPIIGAALATNFNIGAIITSILCLGISIAIYLPFVLLANKQYAKMGQAK